MSEEIPVPIPDELNEAQRRARVGQLIADGHRRIPQDDDELEAARRAAIRSIQQEPW